LEKWADNTDTTIVRAPADSAIHLASTETPVIESQAPARGGRGVARMTAVNPEFPGLYALAKKPQGNAWVLVTNSKWRMALHPCFLGEAG
jgi:hypothetical protein